MPKLEPRPWVAEKCEGYVQRIAAEAAEAESTALAGRISDLIALNRRIHERDCFNLNPAANVMNPAAEAALASGLGTRPSLGYPGEKYETGLEAIEQIEVIAAELAAEIFGADYAEIRVPSGAIANLYGFMALARPGDHIITPPAAIGGHVTHHREGAAGLYGLTSHMAPVDADGFSVDLAAMRALAHEVKPRLITIGGSLNLFPHPVAEIREIAEEVGAHVLFDAAHQCGIIAGKAWENPLDQGAHVMTMSTYKSLAGPPSGLIVTNSAEIAERLDHIAFPGLTANFDAGKSAALALTLLDWREHGQACAEKMIATARALAEALARGGLPVFTTPRGHTASHQFAIEAATLGGGQGASARLRRAGFLASGIGLPCDPVAGDLNGLRLGTPELVRWGFTEEDAPRMARLIAEALNRDDPEALAPEVAEWRRSFSRIHYIRS